MAKGAELSLRFPAHAPGGSKPKFPLQLLLLAVDLFPRRRHTKLLTVVSGVGDVLTGPS